MVALGVCLSYGGWVQGEDSGESEAERRFVLEVQPLLAEKCLSCHGNDSEDVRGELDLRSRESMIRGGETSDQVLVPGNASASLLYRAVTWEDADYQMPPKENDRLTEAQTWAIRDWIDAGAPWPDADRAAAIRKAAENDQGEHVQTSGGLSEQWTRRRYAPEDLWAYRPLVTPAIPPGDDGSPIDAFINRKLEDLKLAPAPRADRRTLIRRATFDLWGLPPTPDEVAAFMADPAPDREAFAKVVDRLLASPHYGEQWGRHWLDVVRYADTSGLANDYTRPNAWRYRDYVIRSLNHDKPYDEFVREQIAGDEIDPQDPEHLIAAGFLRMGPWEQTGMSVASVTRQQFLDDVTDIVGQVFLSHPLQCCRCHDHKFDPIPTRDYYSIQSVFATTQFAERDAPFLAEENVSGFDRERDYLSERIARYENILKHIRAKNEQAERQWYAERNRPYVPRSQLLKQGVPESQMPPRHLGLSIEDQGMDRVARKYLTRHRWELDRFRPIAFSVYAGRTRLLTNVQSRLTMPADPLREGKLEETAILVGGSLSNRGPVVHPGVLSCLSLAGDPQALDPQAIPESVVGRRKALADWIASPSNPLTLRSIVNRIWQYHFGQGLAGNPNNFGATGKKPTHPELLDWLAVTFRDEDWSFKRLHRHIMLSDAYCRSSEHPEIDRVKQQDPTGTSYARFRPRRLEAEEIRDAMLAVTGELNKAIGGIPVRPEINLEVALQPRQIMGTYAPAYQPSPKREDRHRRSVYAERIRGLRDPFMEVFNQPSSALSCERREVSTVTPQVFALFNSRQTADRALALARRVRRETDSRRDTIQRIFELALNRQATDQELSRCEQHWRNMTQRQKEIAWKPVDPPTEVTRQAVEEMSGETFTFVELLESARDFVPDAKPWDVDPETRALADVCLVLLNSNEFLYVY